jgi:hypothetical protein
MAIMEGTFHAVIGRTQEYVSGGCRLLRGDGIDARGRRSSIFVFISTREVFLSLLAGMSVVAAIKDHGSLYRHGAWRSKDLLAGVATPGALVQQWADDLIAHVNISGRERCESTRPYHVGHRC